MNPVLVIGGGTMATGIAATLIAAGFDTVMRVRRPEAVDAARAEVLRRARPAAPLTVTTSAPAGPFAVAIESVAENLATKRAVLTLAETLLAPGGILTTNTSSLSLSELAKDLAHPETFAGWHWFNPAELVPLVEVVGAPGTAPATLTRLTELSAQIGKHPVTVRKDVPGFVANRLQYALIREAYALVADGVCTVEDVDQAVVSGLGIRWAGIGPFAAMDAAGLDVHEAVARQLFPRLSNSTEIPALLRMARERGAFYPPEHKQQIAQRRDDVLALLTRTPL
jgi:3-hydroxybutyryl-CoA dehydrogenase